MIEEVTLVFSLSICAYRFHLSQNHLRCASLLQFALEKSKQRESQIILLIVEPKCLFRGWIVCWWLPSQRHPKHCIQLSPFDILRTSYCSVFKIPGHFMCHLRLPLMPLMFNFSDCSDFRIPGHFTCRLHWVPGIISTWFMFTAVLIAMCISDKPG